MTLWILMGALTALVLGFLLRPLLRPARPASAAAPALAVYRDQLAEIERDRAAGRLPEREAEAARREVERRLLGAADTAAPRPAADRPARRLAWALVLLLPVAALGLYLWQGAPELPDQPLAGRADVRMQQALLQREGELRQTLTEDTADGGAWQELGLILTLLGRPEQAAEAYRQALVNGAPVAAANAGLAEALILAADGVVGPEARQALAAALQADPAEPLALYYVGHALEQDGRLQPALDLWVELARFSPPGTPWRERLLIDIARVAGKLGIDPATLDLAPRP